MPATNPAKPAPGFSFLPYQERWIKDGSRLKLMEKSRQIGLSWCTAYSCVRRQAMDIAKLDTWVSSRDEIQARLFLADCKVFAQVLDRAAQDLGLRAIDDHGHSALVLSMGNGTRINSMSSNPNAQAGKRGTRVLDEFALHPDPRQLYAIAYPGITWGGQLEIVSTHRGADNFFNQLVREIRERGNPKGFSLHTVTLQDALDQGFLGKLKVKLPADDERQQMDEAAYFDFIRAGCADEETFQQEYMCRPALENDAFIPWELIYGCEYEPGIPWELDLAECWTEGGRLTPELYLGVDIGREHDLTAFWLVERCGGVTLTRKVLTLEKTPFAEQEEVLDSFLSLPNLRRVCIDQSGLGRQFAERAMARYGKYRVEGVTFTAGIKEELAYPVRSAMEDRALRLPQDKYIRADLRAIKKESTAAGNIRFTADRGKNGHADRFWALALALHAAKKPAVAYQAINIF
jgi:phage FluMu gp28-like protein